MTGEKVGRPGVGGQGGRPGKKLDGAGGYARSVGDVETIGEKADVASEAVAVAADEEAHVSDLGGEGADPFVMGGKTVRARRHQLVVERFEGMPHGDGDAVMAEIDAVRFEGGHIERRGSGIREHASQRRHCGGLQAGIICHRRFLSLLRLSQNKE